ncbi:MAG TPA: YiiD C-terminal domain-containing protein [Pseudoxanthomonas sp.]|nr:YiiD C-terminal domain-containing protein [Pseudoxanthomonas sp.]
MDADSMEAALEILRAHTRDIPPVAAIRARIAAYDGHCLRLAAPLAANVNDKGSAFGGSMTSLMTYAGWGLVTLQLLQAGIQADVFVADSTVRYRKPLYADLQATATLAAGESWEPFVATLTQRGRARIQVQAQILLRVDEMPEGETMADFAGRYVAIAKG